MEKEENEKMKALARYGKEFGGYRMIDVPKPTCGPEDIIIEIKAAAICGADMKHYKVDNVLQPEQLISLRTQIALKVMLL